MVRIATLCDLVVGCYSDGMTNANRQAPSTTAPDASAIIDFWFGPPDDPARTEKRQLWWQKDPEFDREIAHRFAGSVAEAANGGFEDWEKTPETALALLILLDQFPRNIHRGSPAAFAGDPRARHLADQFVNKGWDAKLPAAWRQFVYLPFQHSEDLEDQKRCLALAATLPDEAEEESFLDFSRRHYEIIARFGRFPHRNDALGRETTEEEAAFLKQPGSSF